MAYTDVLSRVAGIESMLAQLASPISATAATSTATSAGGVSATGAGSFPAVLSAASSGTQGAQAAGLGSPASGGSAGLRALAVARGEIGVREQPPGSNDGPRLATYRSAVAGSYAGAPWCAYFVSWAAAQAGAPIGDGGTGLGSVAQIHDWAQRTGRLVSQPQAGDLILFGTAHVGIVESVNPDGSLTTVEGNSSDQVARRQHSPGEATAFVRL
jgi:cell wall-associated NlpC family hydrolase